MKTQRSLILLFAFVFCLVVLAFFAPTARANPGVIRVKVNGATSSPCGNLANWSNPCDLQYALTTVAVSGDELWVSKGTYTPTTTGSRAATFQLRNGIALYGGFEGNEDALDERDWTTNATTLSGEIGATGNSDNSYHVVTGSGTNSTAVLDGFTVTGGNANGSSWPNDVGGGMYNSGGSPTLTNITFSGNSADAGGGMYNDSSSPTLTNVTFSGNSATDGGGMRNDISSPTLTNVTFSGNSASTDGGGMHNVSASSPTLTNVTFSGNSASGDGGGMRNAGDSNPTLTNVTFSSNSAESGGGMCNSYSSPRIRNAILWSNTPSGSQIYNYSGTPIVSDSVVQGGYVGGSHIITTNPFLGALGNYGGGTATVPLLPGSSAIDAGNDSNCPTTDQRGFTRPQGAHCDIGAFESRGFVFTKNGDNQITPINTVFSSALTVNVSSPYGEPVNGNVFIFTVPSSGASTNPISRTVTIAGGAASASFSANGTVGAYVVNATTGNTTVLFGLANLKGNTTTTITSSANPSLLGNTVTFTVTVTSPSGGTPSGTVDFYETTSPTAPARAPRKTLASQPLVGGQATFIAPSLTLGTHNMLAIYSGDANYTASNSAPFAQQVQFNSGLNFFLPWTSKNP